MLSGKEAIIMPLGRSISRNISELYHAKKKRKKSQIIAIAYAAAKRSKKYG